MNNPIKTKKLQYLSEHLIIMMSLAFSLLIFFEYPDKKTLLIFCISTLIILVVVFELLKFKGKWFKSRTHIPKLITGAVIISALLAVRFSNEGSIPRMLGLIYPPALVTLIAFIDYRLIFNRENNI